MYVLQNSSLLVEREELQPLPPVITHRSEKWWDDPGSIKVFRQPNVKGRLTEKREASKDPLWKKDRKLIRVEGEVISHESIPNKYNETISNFDASLSSQLWACSRSKDLSLGIRLHHKLKKNGLVERDYADALITMYARCGELQKAQTLLNVHKCSSVIPWNALMSSYARDGQGQKALHCFEEMLGEGIHPSVVSYMCALKGCAVIGGISKGMEIHDEILRLELLERSVELGGALVDMYARSGALPEAHDVVKELPACDAASWNALITGHIQQGQSEQALELVEEMQQKGIFPNEVTFVCILKACTLIGAMEKGIEIHDFISKQGLLGDNLVLGGALVDMYVKCGDPIRGKSVLKSLPSRDVISWNSLISGFAEDEIQEALDCVHEMQTEGIAPNAVTFVYILKSCAAVGDLEKGQKMHDEILKRGLLEHNMILGSAIINMYANAMHFLRLKVCLRIFQ